MNKLTYILIVFGLICTTLVVRSQNRGIDTTGDVILYALPAATLGSTLILDDTEGTWQFAKGVLVTGVVTFGLKAIIHKERPDSSNFNSFPSAHTAITFHSAAFIHERYGIGYGIPAYVLAGFSAFSRIEAEKHDGWDVLAGGIIGVLSSRLFTTRLNTDKMDISFNIINNAYSLTLSMRF